MMLICHQYKENLKLSYTAKQRVERGPFCGFKKGGKLV